MISSSFSLMKHLVDEGRHDMSGQACLNSKKKKGVAIQKIRTWQAAVALSALGRGVAVWLCATSIPYSISECNLH
jgi:hypothetical protein